MEEPKFEVREWSRGGQRRAALLQELAYAYNLGQYEVPGACGSPGGIQIYLPDHRDQRQLTDDNHVALSQLWNLHEPLLDEAIEGYTRFRQSIEAVARIHSGTFQLWTKRVANEKDAAKWIAHESDNPSDPEFAVLNGALSDLKTEMTKWKLAYEGSDAPLVNPLAVAIALGIEDTRKWHHKDGPDRIEVVPNLGGGTFLQGIGYGRMCSPFGNPPPEEGVELLGLKVVRPGSGRTAQYQLQDGQWWVLRYVGGVKLVSIALKTNIYRQEIQKSFKNTNRVLRGA